MRRTAGQSPTFVTARMGSTHSAYANMHVLRARLTLQPFRIRYPGSQPPAMLSTVTIV